MKIDRTILTLTALLFAVPLTSLAQTSVPMAGDMTRRAGDREFTLGGSGATNKDFDNSFGGVNFSVGKYLNETQEVLVRQSINYSNPSVGGQQWNGSTRLAFDQHFAARGPLRPFVGVNFGGAYGDAVRDTFAAGLEGGAKYYVMPRTFVFAMLDYSWFFRHARNVDDRFRDGQFNWGVGIGFNF